MPSFDPLPSVPVAGRRAQKRSLNNGSVSDCLVSPREERPSPRSRRPAPLVPSDMVFGCSTVPNDSVKGVMESQRQPVFAPPARQYASDAREPLGKSRSFGVVLPAHTDAPDFRFGVKSVTDVSSKVLLYPPGDVPQTNPTKEAMHQTDRHYDWAKVGIDPAQHTFGAPSVRQATEQYSPTRLGDARVVKPEGALPFEVSTASSTIASPTKSRSGKGAGSPEYASVAAALVNSPNALRDEGIGKREIKSVTLRNQQASDAPRDPDRVFGLPSIRTDLSPPKVSRIAEERSIGPQVSAGQVLCPKGRNAELGYHSSIASPAAAVEFCARCKLDLAETDVARAYAMASNDGAPVTVSSLIDAVNRLGL